MLCRVFPSTFATVSLTPRPQLELEGDERSIWRTYLMTAMLTGAVVLDRWIECEPDMIDLVTRRERLLFTNSSPQLRSIGEECRCGQEASEGGATWCSVWRHSFYFHLDFLHVDFAPTISSPPDLNHNETPTWAGGKLIPSPSLRGHRSHNNLPLLHLPTPSQRRPRKTLRPPARSTQRPEQYGSNKPKPQKHNQIHRHRYSLTCRPHIPPFQYHNHNHILSLA